MVTGQHSHDSELQSKIAKEEVKKAVVKAGRNTSTSPRTALANLTNKLESSPTTSKAINSLSKPKTFAKAVQRERQRKLMCPKIPHT